MQQSELIPFVRKDLHILFIGLNPAAGSSRNRRYFSVNQAFWNQLYEAGLITQRVNKSRADERVFGGTAVNFRGWSFGITDLVTDVAESDSRKVKPTLHHCQQLEQTVLEYQPHVVVLMHGKVVKSFLANLGRTAPKPITGELGPLLETRTMFFSVAFPHGNPIPTSEKTRVYRAAKEYLLNTQREP
jgi:hypothetical protein